MYFYGHKTLMLLLLTIIQKQSIYVNFINEFIRELCLPLRDADVRKVANTLSTLASEKQKQIKEKEKSKKKGTIYSF